MNNLVLSNPEWDEIIILFYFEYNRGAWLLDGAMWAYLSMAFLAKQRAAQVYRLS